METIDIRKPSVGEHFLIASTVFHKKLKDLKNLSEFATKDGQYKVEFRVNGVDLPFNETIAELFKRFERETEKRAAKKALEIIELTGFQKLIDVIRDSEWKIKEKITEVTGIKFEED